MSVLHHDFSKPPLTDAEMRAMWDAGESLSTIAAKARIRNGFGKHRVRQIVFGGKGERHA